MLKRKRKNKVKKQDLTSYKGELSLLARKDVKGNYVTTFNVNVIYPMKQDFLYGYFRELESISLYPDTVIKSRVIWQRNSTKDSTAMFANIEKLATNGNAEGDDEVEGAQMFDVQLAEQNVGQIGYFVDYQVKVIIIAKSEKELKEEVDNIRASLKKESLKPYIFTISGNEIEEMNNIHKALPKSAKVFTSDYNEFSFALPYPKRTIHDKDGLPVGRRVDAVSTAQVLLNLNRFSENHQAIVAFNDKQIGHMNYEMAIESQENDEEDESGGLVSYTRELPDSSLTLQRAANQNVMQGGRSINIILNEFDPNQVSTSEVSRSDSQFSDARIYDVSQTPINFMQVFGNVEDVDILYKNQVNKMVEIFNQIAPNGLNDSQQTTLHKDLQNFYEKSGLKLTRDEINAKTHPEHVKLINTPDNLYPTATQFLETLIGQNTRALAVGSNKTDARRDNDEDLAQILENAINDYRSLFSSHTKISNENFKQLWFKLSRYISTPDIQMAVFLNTITYVNSRLRKGDVVLIHGCEYINSGAWEVLKPIVEQAQTRGINFIFGFGIISGLEGKIGALDTKDILYKDLYVDFDWLYLSKMNEDEGKVFKKDFKPTEINPKTIDTLVETTDKSIRVFLRQQDRSKIRFSSSLDC